MHRPFLLALGLCALWFALAPVVAWAQPGCLECEGGGGPGGFEPSPPEVHIEQMQTAYAGLTPTQVLEVSVLVCANGPVGGTVRIRSDTVHEFRWEPPTVDPACGQRIATRGNGRVTLVAGPNALWVGACTSPLDCGEDARVFSYSWLTRGVAVTPDEGVAVAAAGVQAQQAFTVINAGTAPVDVSFAATCTGTVTACVAPATAAGVQPGTSRVVMVTYTPGAAGSVGDIRLRGSVVGQTALYDDGTVQVSVPNPSGVAATPTVELLTVNPEATPTPGVCVTLPAGPGASWTCGELRLAHAAPGFATLGRMRQPVLVYGSAHAHPAPVVRARVRVPAGGRAPELVRVVLRVNGTQRAAQTYAGAEWAGTTYRHVAVGFDGSDLGTGLHPYRLEVTSVYGDTLRTRTADGMLAVVNRGGSPYGAGWWVAGLEHLVQITSDSVTWVGSDGAMRRYRRVGTSADTVRFAAPSVAHPDTLLRLTDGTYRRLLPNRVAVRFDAQGRHVATVTPTTETRFGWEVATGLLRELHVPIRRGEWLSHTFQYTALSGGAWRLQRIQRAYDALGNATPADASALRVEHAAGTNRITRFVDPDGHSVAFAYEDVQAPLRVTRRTDRMGVPTTYAYGTGGRLVQTSTPVAGAVPVVHRYEPGATRGWVHSDTRSETRYLAPGPESRAVRFLTSALGAPTRIHDPLGRYTDIGYDGAFPGLAVRVRHFDARVSRAVYDARARLTMVIDSSSYGVGPNGDSTYAATRYAYEDPNWPHRPTRVSSPMGEETRTTYHAQWGVPLTVTDARGAAAETQFYYSDTGRLLYGVLSPENRGATWQAHRWAYFGYDPMGNLEYSSTPLGFTTYFYKDALGRDTLILSPVNHPTAGLRTEQRIVYDAMDRVRTTRSTGPEIGFDRLFMAGAATPDELPAEEVWTETEYDAEGRTRRVSRGSVPDTARIGVVTTRWLHDALGRVVSEIAPDGRRDSTFYDPQGRVAGYLSRRGHAITMRYDAAGRLVERVTPAVAYGPRIQTFTHGSNAPWYFPLFTPGPDGIFAEQVATGANGFTIPADTARFAYDSAGRVLTANNRDARVTRVYHPNGLLKSETQRIRAYADTAFPHVYTLSYDYDLNGRRTHLHHPPNLFPGPSAAPHHTRWVWDALGRLEAVSHAATFAGAGFSYDLEGRITEVAAVVPTRMGYDADGRLTWRRDGHDGARLRREGYEYDARGKLTVVRGYDRAEEQTLWSGNAYTGLGALGWSATVDASGQGSFMAERVEHDALGNAVRIGREASGGTQIPQMDFEMNHKGFLYEAGTGRLRRDWIGGDTALATERRRYDAAGNQEWRWREAIQRTPWAFPVPNGSTTTPDARLSEETFYYYDAAERLRVLDRRSCLIAHWDCTDKTPQLDDRSVFEEHRYDALGRRVLLRTRQAPQAFCAAVLCRSNMVRAVWDGDQLLHEVSAPASGPLREVDVPPIAESFLGPHHYGRVLYVHGGGIDQPVAVVRSEYSDSLPRGTVYPLANHKGQYDMGISTCVLVTPRSPMLLEHGGEQQIGADTTTHQIGDTRPYEHCVRVDWPGRSSFSSGFRRHSWGPAPPWVGSLLYHGKDPSGQMYRRNRFYDPQSGRFTQEDPIGIAGGLNVYGYANGDPITYSDPYGLSAICCRLGLPTPRSSPDDPESERPSRGVLAHGASLAAIGQAAEDWWEANREDVILVGVTFLSRGASGGGGRPARLAPHPNAQGPHSTFRTNGSTGRVNHYETYRPQRNPRNPSRWERVKRVDVEGPAHGDVPTPHTHRGNSREPPRPSRQNELP